MLFSPGWRAPVRQGWVLAVFTLGLVLGGTLSAAVLWLLSGLAAPVPPPARTAAIVAVAALGAARDLGLVRLRLPQNARQIPPEVLADRLRAGALRFGFELGTGVRTYVSATTPYVLALGLLLSRPGSAATLLAGAAFGAGRALSAVLAYLSRSPDRAALVGRRVPVVVKGAALAALTALAWLHLG
ncbi:hypothetical protein Acsp04_34870 [Actinomadura sp. NBRC 104425]|uniref:hypothetical protein n=1 Tax=Actinomadura sp. NBRC 104425 TaxID=3032204 RepID=UPI0024A60484|nr:hypothetical protein [Actinomadura sp. NBRC 104425]GLZ13252.1 hypothetical protein Acsp04_34870 [Actinomadura sp. NBRC 104425]